MHTTVMDKMTYALKDGQLVSIDDVESGLACNCICPACHQKLIARKGKIRVHHFKHETNSSCDYAYETSLHFMAKEIFQNASSFAVPELKFGKLNPLILENAQEIRIKNVYIEQNSKHVKPDVIIEDFNNVKYFIEIYVTHKIDNEKLERIKKEAVNTLEYDLSKIKGPISYEELSNILLNGAIIPKWIYHNKILEAQQLYSVCPGEIVYCNLHKGKPLKAYDCIFYCKNLIGYTDDHKILFCKDITNPGSHCPRCGGKLVRKKSKYGEFWGCENYPECTYKKSIK